MSTRKLIREVEQFICHTCLNRIGWTGEFDMAQSRFENATPWDILHFCAGIVERALAQTTPPPSKEHPNG